MIRRCANLVISVGILAVVFWWVGAERVWAQLETISPMWLTLAVLALTLSTLSMARRWQLTAQALQLELRYASALKEYYLSLLANAVLPGGVLGDIGRAIRLRHSGDLRRAGQSVLAERLLGQGAMILILIMGFAYALLHPGGIDWPMGTGWLLVAGLAIGGLGIAVLCLSRPARTFLHLCLRLLNRPTMVLHALGAALALIVALYACARATGTVLPPEALVTVLPLVFCAMLIPLSIAGWGWREGAAAALFPIIGATPEAGVAMGLAYGLIMLVAALPGAFFMLNDPKPVAPERA